MIKVRGTLGSGWVGGGGHWKTWQGPLETPFASADSARSGHRLTIGVHGLADELAVTLHTDSTGLNRSWPRTIPTHPRDRPGRFLDAGTRTSYAGGARCHLRILVHGPLRSYAY